MLLGWSSIHFDAAAEEVRVELSSNLLDPPGPYKVFIPLVIQPDLDPPNLEITQGIQEPANAVALVADRPTFVRYTVTSTTPYDDVHAYLYGFRDGFPLPGSPIEAVNNPRSLKPSANRDVLGDTFNFFLPQDWTRDEIILSGSASNSTGYNHFSSAQSFTFLDTGPLSVTIVPIAYTCTSGGSGTHTPVQPYDYLVDLTYRVYPVPGINTITHTPLGYSGPCTAGIPDPTYSPGLPYDDSDWERLLGLVTTTWQTEGSPNSYYYGLMDVYCGGGCISGIGWIGGSKAAVGFTGIGASHAYASDTHAHEVGHNHGLRHAPGCGATGLDPYPYASGLIGDATHLNQGFDLINPSLKTYSTYYDLMSYCDPVWISDYNYDRLMSLYILPGQISPSSNGGDSLVVSGAITENAANFNPTFTLDVPSVVPIPGPYSLDLLDANGTVLRSYPFMPDEAHADPTEGPPLESILGFHLTVPAEPGVAQIRVQHSGELLGSVQEQVISSDRAGADFTVEGRSLTLPAGAPVLVRASTDGGATWQTIALDHRPSAGDIDLSHFKGRQVQIEIHISNGVGSEAIEFGPLTIP